MVNWRKKHCFWGAEKACLSHFSQYPIAVSVLFPSLNPERGGGKDQNVEIPVAKLGSKGW